AGGQNRCGPGRTYRDQPPPLLGERFSFHATFLTATSVSTVHAHPTRHVYVPLAYTFNNISPGQEDSCPLIAVSFSKKGANPAAESLWVLGSGLQHAF